MNAWDVERTTVGSVSSASPEFVIMTLRSSSDAWQTPSEAGHPPLSPLPLLCRQLSADRAKLLVSLRSIALSSCVEAYPSHQKCPRHKYKAHHDHRDSALSPVRHVRGRI